MTNEKGEERGSIVDLHAYWKRNAYRELRDTVPDAEILGNGKVILIPEAAKGLLVKTIVQLLELATVKAFVIAHDDNRVQILVHRDTGIIPARHSEIRAIFGKEAHDERIIKLGSNYYTYTSSPSKANVRQVAETVVRLLEESEE